MNFTVYIVISGDKKKLPGKTRKRELVDLLLPRQGWNEKWGPTGGTETRLQTKWHVNEVSVGGGGGIRKYIKLFPILKREKMLSMDLGTILGAFGKIKARVAAFNYIHIPFRNTHKWRINGFKGEKVEWNENPRGFSVEAFNTLFCLFVC